MQRSTRLRNRIHHEKDLPYRRFLTELGRDIRALLMATARPSNIQFHLALSQPKLVPVCPAASRTGTANSETAQACAAQ